MRNVITGLVLSLVAGFIATPAMAQQKRVSPHETLSTVIGEQRTGNRVTLTYGRPYSKDPNGGAIRKIWGGLVPWGKAWRLGSDEATLLLTQQPIAFGDTVIPAGAYTLYLVPDENGTTKLAFSSKLGGWGIPVDEKSDVARVDVKKDTVSTSVDQFTMSIDKDGAGGVIKMTWETTQFSAAFVVKK